MTRIAIVEWQDGLMPGTEQWRDIRDRIDQASPDILITNEMPFGKWLPKAKVFDADLAACWAQLHEDALDALSTLNVPTIVSSRPVMNFDLLANEAFLLQGGNYRFLHQKHLFPAEPNWEEASWFKPVRYGFDPQPAGKTSIGALLCTELMFAQCAKWLGRKGADVIASPRASGSNFSLWHAAGVMAATSAGAYVLSSNRVQKPIFGGGGFAIDPSGRLIASTSAEVPMVVVEIDENAARTAKHQYPAYVRETYITGTFGDEGL